MRSVARGQVEQREQLRQCSAMEESVREVLYETRNHASMPYYSNYPPLPQANKGGAKGGFLSFLSIRGVSQLKEKWSGYAYPRKIKRKASLFVSPRGERVAIAAGNQITILRKEDDYQEPFGIFTCSSVSSFSHGTWSESYDILGVVDNCDTLIFIKANGEEVTRVTRKHLKVSSPILGLLLENDTDVQRSCLCSFIMLASDGSLRYIEISQEKSTSTSSVHLLTSSSMVKRQFPQKVFCIDYYPEFSLLVVVGSAVNMAQTSSGNSGSCCLSVWRKCQDLDLEPLLFTQFEGLYSESEGYAGQLAYPKVLISPLGKFVATLDMTGCLHIFNLEKGRSSLLDFPVHEKSETKMIGGQLNLCDENLRDIVDFTWWSNHILTLVKGSGFVTMFDILRGLKVQENDSVYSAPIVERVQKFKGHVFLLDSISSEEGFDSSDCCKETDLNDQEQISQDNFNQLEISRLHWILISFSEKSVTEMYKLLIGSHKYQTAMNFADCHGLDKNEVLKSQWLHSKQGINEINMILSNIEDQVFVLSECVDRVGPTEDAVKALLAYGLRLTNQYGFSGSEGDDCNQIWNFRMARLQLLQFSDRLETYLGINMGRFSMQEYRKFRVMPLNEAAVTLAESGKIGALNLLFKRHPYSLASSMVQVLAAIPETVPAQTYMQLLPGRSPPTSIAMREEDWVECDKMVEFINRLPKDHEIITQIRTEPIVKRCLESFWPSTEELSEWYKNRARDIDSYSGQLDNCLCLIDFACRKGISGLQQFHGDISYLNRLIYSDKNDGEIYLSMSLVSWEKLSDYEKFRTMLKGVKEEKMVERLHNLAIPFMQDRFCNVVSAAEYQYKNESFLVRWMKEVALENKLDLCLMIIEEGCRDIKSNRFFRDEVEAIDCALQCIYLCTLTDRWSTMSLILSKLPQRQDMETYIEELEQRRKLAEEHIEAGRLLAFYQVPKPINYFLEAHLDEKGVKQILRLILSKFSRRQPGRSDNDWASMWHDMQSLQKISFPFLDLEYMLMEFCRGLLKAGKFSLARNYLKGTGSVSLPSEKAEDLVIKAAREYFFSASSLASSEIWKAKECLNLFPNSRNVKAEADLIDALAVKLPNLGVTLLPMQFRQIKDPMEIIKMAITSQPGAYLHVGELIEVAKLLGLNSFRDISTVEEAIAREAAVAGDLQLAFDLCLVLTRKGHGQIWDLCAAIARGPALENMDVSSRKQLLGFALSHCDEESIGELLHAWKDLDLQGQCETLMLLTGTDAPNFSVQGSSITSPSGYSTQDMVGLKDCPGLVEGISNDDQELHVNSIKNTICTVVKTLPADNGTNWESFLGENGKFFSFAASKLPWLLELSRNQESGKKLISGSFPRKQFVSLKTTAIVTILSWLARNDFAPKDDLIASLAKSIMEPPVTEEEDITGCSFLLNLTDAFNGVTVIEEQLRTREEYQEICNIMNMGMIYSLLHSCGVDCGGPAQRRELLWRKFKEKHMPPSSDEMNKIDKVQSTFWREWKLKLEEKKCAADRSRVLEQIIPGVETARFLSGDVNYIKSVVFTLIDSVKLEKKQILKDLLQLADTYGLNRAEVILRYLSSILVSEIWTNDDITAEISEVKEEILGFAPQTIKTISLFVYPAVDGCNKLRLAYLYSLLSDCYLQLEESKDSLSVIQPDLPHVLSLGLPQFYKIIEQECRRVSFIKNLNFKNIAGLSGLNLQSFSTEVYTHVNEYSLEALAKMVQILAGIYADQVPEGLISWQDVHKYYALSMLDTLKSKIRTDFNIKSPENFQDLIVQIEQTYDFSKMHIKLLEPLEALDIMKQYFIVIIPLYSSCKSLPDNSAWQDCLIFLVNFWIRLTEEMQELMCSENSVENLRFNPECIMSCLKIFMRLVMEDSISPSQAWATILGYLNCGLCGDCALVIFAFCRAMIFSGCGFVTLSEVFHETLSQCQTSLAPAADPGLQDLPHLYLSILEPILQDIVHGFYEDQNLYNLLSSLSYLVGDLDELMKVRQVVWERIASFSENLQLPSQVRVYALELMQFISARNIKGFSSGLQSHVLPWEGWDEMLDIDRKTENADNQGVQDQTNGSSRFTSTLVALRSSQLVAVISPDIQITSDDLLNTESAVSCFLKLSAAACKDSHIDSLLSILEEWEGLFVTRGNEVASRNISDPGNNWSNDEWDEGWETFQEDEPLENEKKEASCSIHPLHQCWVEIFQKLITLSRLRDVLILIDHSLSKCNGVLINEDEAGTLSQILLGKDCFLALKMVLLLPYEAKRLQCLSLVEEKLKQEGIPETGSQDHELLLLLLSSEVIPTVISQSSYGTLFSYICYLVGNFSHQFQEAKLLRLTKKGKNELSKNEKDYLFLFRRIIFPCFLSELIKGDQQILAGFIVTKFMHTNASLSLVNIAGASISRFLKKELHSLEHEKFGVEEMRSEALTNTVLRLRDKMTILIQSALSVLSTSNI